ncbi:sulfatase [Lutibacter sp. TH_r2]|uniref:sulfatase family protein n=1 Tax=Lutibacter sp. TH_r2 TaxID=3082083 RepID=UPI0029554ACE|nr:sulfatase [Lutibacter sp. TH_r2]MDV7185876.1 sulfatase [Lutibacter sp. TH_r2]
MKYTRIFLLGALITLSACKSQVVEQPNIIWIVSEDNSKHYLKMFDEHGIETPNIESLAENGVVFDRAFSNAAVCSAARSTLISSSYGPRAASHYHRRIQEVPLPNDVAMFPAYLKQAGYYTANNAKEDYNFVKGDTVWDMSSKKATWRGRKENQPFFYVYNIGTTHEGRLHFDEEVLNKGIEENKNTEVFIQPNHPQTETFKYTNIHYRKKIVEMDTEVGDILEKLKEDGLYKDAFIFYYGDHGGVLPDSKGYLTETGLHVPLVVHVPEKYKHLVNQKIGSRTNQFVSFVDFGATVLNLAGIEIPKAMDGKPFLGKNAVTDNDITYSYADRFDEKYDMVRAVRKGKYKYVRNYMPFNFDGLMNEYRYKQLAYKEWAQLYKDNKLNKIQSQFFESKQPEALYNVEEDPFETNNLAGNKEYIETLNNMRNKMTTWVKSMPDLSFYPEYYLINNAFENPVEFGQTNKANIEKYIDISNLVYKDFNDVKNELEQHLKSSDTWERYWGIIISGSYKNSDKNLNAIIADIANNDDELINRVRAAEYLGLKGIKNPAEVIQEAVYKSNDGAEALLIFNTIVLLQDGYNYKIDIDFDKLSEVVKNDKQVQRRLEYLKIGK